MLKLKHVFYFALFLIPKEGENEPSLLGWRCRCCTRCCLCCCLQKTHWIFLVKNTLADRMKHWNNQVTLWEKSPNDPHSVYFYDLTWKRKVAMEWVEMSAFERLIRIPPIGIAVKH